MVLHFDPSGRGELGVEPAGQWQAHFPRGQHFAYLHEKNKSVKEHAYCQKKVGMCDRAYLMEGIVAHDKQHHGIPHGQYALLDGAGNDDIVQTYVQKIREKNSAEFTELEKEEKILMHDEKGRLQLLSNRSKLPPSSTDHDGSVR